MESPVSRRSRVSLRVAVAAICGLVSVVESAHAVIISEIHYHPSELESGRHEFVELYNENADPVDLSGLSICDGVDFVIPEGTFLLGHSFLVVCADPAVIAARHGIDNVVGGWFGSLDNDGEEIKICNPGGRTVARVDYRDRGKWAAGADGTGHSLELVDPFVALDDPDSWRLSVEPGGSPGRPNPCWREPEGAGEPGGRVGEFSSHADIGGPCGAGDTIYSALTRRYEITGGGDDVWTGGDQFQFAWVRIDGDFDIRARITARAWVDGQRWGKGGLMCRQDLTPTSRHVFIHDCPGTDGARLARRTDHGGSNDEEPWVEDGHPDWYRLARSGDTITGYWSNDGSSWSRFGGELNGTTTWDGGDVTHVGLALTSHGACSTSQLTFGDLSITGEVLEDAVTGGGGDSDPIFNPLSGACARRPQIRINEALLRGAGERWVELYNAGDEPTDLAGFHLSDERRQLTKFAIPPGEVLAPGGHRVFTEAELGFDLAVRPERAELFLVLSAPDSSSSGNGVRVVDARNFRPGHDELSEALVPDGSDELRDAATPTRGAPNRLDVRSDIVINEILYHPIDHSSDGEFVEILNVGASSVELGGWRFTNGIRYAFPPGSTIAAGEHLVVARNPSRIRAVYELDANQVLGPEDEIAREDFGSLRDSGERVTLQDELGRTVDTVRYHDGNEWPRWADGHGSSLELIDPFQDNRVGMAWDASDDSGKSRVRRFEYSGVDGAGEDELHLLLLSRGIAIVDNISVRAGGAAGPERVVNGDFDASASGWTIEGTHVRSGRTTTQAIAGAGSLKIIATGRGDNKVNRIETDNSGLGALSTTAENVVSFDAKWHVGSSTINVHGFQHAMARTFALDVPTKLGTPGARNSVTARRIAATGSFDLGPVLTRLELSPQIPEADEDVTIRVQISDADGVASARIRWSLDDPSALPFTVSLRAVGNEIWEGVIPAQAEGRKVVFFIEASDAGGRDARYPVDVLERSHPLVLDASASLDDQSYFIYRHESRATVGSFHDYRFYMTDRSETELTTRRRLSNDLIPGCLAFAGQRLYQGAAMRFSGSPWARGGWNGSFRVVAPRDAPMHGRIRKFNLEEHHGNGLDARERIAHYLIRKNQGATSVPYSEVQTMSRFRVNDRNAGVREHVWVPDTQYVDLWFDSDDGDFLEMDDRFVIDDNGNRTGSTDARALHPPPSPRASPRASPPGSADGGDKENYRWFFGLRSRNGSDDFRSLLSFCALMDPTFTSNSSFDAQLFDRVNVEEFLRIWAIRFNQSDWDQWGADRGKNCYLYLDPASGRWNLLAWDMELTCETGRLDQFLVPADPNSPFSPGQFSEVNRFLNRPKVKRMYYAILDEMVNGSAAFFTSSHLSTYAGLLSDLGMSSTAIMRPGGYIDQRRDRIRSRIAGVVDVAFTISTNGGNAIETRDLEIDLAGEGPASASLITIGSASYPVEPSSMTGWRVEDVPLAVGVNDLQLFAFNLRGDLVGADSIRVTAGSRLEFLRGDTNDDGRLDLSDPIRILGALFAGASLDCEDAADVDDDGVLSVTDAIHALEHLFRGGEPPAAPYPTMGVDPSADELRCDR